MIDAILTNTLLPQVSRTFLQRLAEGTATREIAVGAEDGEFQAVFQ